MSTPSTGLVTRTLDEIRQELRDAIASAPGLGPNWQTGPDTPTGQEVDIYARSIYLAEQALQDLWDSTDPDQAGGVALDNIAAIRGVFREAARATTVIVEATGTPATIIPAGSIFAVPNGVQVTTDALATIGGGGTVDIPCTATVTGPIEILASTVTQIVTVIAGLDSVTNNVAGVTGRDVETDQELRARSEIALQSSGYATVPAIRSALLALLIVDQCVVLTNRTPITDVYGLPPHSFRAIVWPDPGVYPADTEIFETIFLTMPAGIEVDGTRSASVDDSQGIPQTVKYSVATALDVYVTATLTVTAAYPLDGDDQVKAKILEITDGLSIGETLFLFYLACASGEVAGVTSAVITAKVGAPPGPGDTADIIPDVDEIITVDIANILVVT